MTFRIIDINSKYVYRAGGDGFIYKNNIRICHWKHYPPRHMGGGPYLRVRIKMKDGNFSFWYAHRLIAIAYHGLNPSSKTIVRHVSSDSMDNRPENLTVGSHKQNQGEDRLRQGTYFNRGPHPDPLLSEIAADLHKELNF